MKNIEYIDELFDFESYYSGVFRRFEQGKYIVNMFNPYAVMSGPLWYANRRICFWWCSISCFVFSFLAHFFLDLISGYLAYLPLLVSYLVLFVFPSNILFYKTVKSYWETIPEGSRIESIARLKQRFESELSRGSRRLKGMHGVE